MIVCIVCIFHVSLCNMIILLHVFVCLRVKKIVLYCIVLNFYTYLNKVQLFFFLVVCVLEKYTYSGYQRSSMYNILNIIQNIMKARCLNKFQQCLELFEINDIMQKEK